MSGCNRQRISLTHGRGSRVLITERLPQESEPAPSFLKLPQNPMPNPDQQIARFLAPFSDDISALAQELRGYLKKETNPTTELVGDSRISLNIGYGFTEKAWDCYCAIIVYSKHINISFLSGATLTDPQKLLQGTGSRIRHIRISELKDARVPAVRKLLQVARKNALALVEEAPSKQAAIRTIVKPISGKKKRPK